MNNQVCCSLGEERMAKGEVEAIYKIKFLSIKKKPQGRWQELGENTANFVFM